MVGTTIFILSFLWWKIVSDYLIFWVLQTLMGLIWVLKLRMNKKDVFGSYYIWNKKIYFLFQISKLSSAGALKPKYNAPFRWPPPNLTTFIRNIFRYFALFSRYLSASIKMTHPVWAYAAIHPQKYMDVKINVAFSALYLCKWR